MAKTKPASNAKSEPKATSGSPSLAPGQQINCTLNVVPRAENDRKTIARLMRRDPVAAKGLRRAQRLRRQTTIVYNRGNRDWVKRQPCSKHVHVVRGEAWSMTYTPDLAHEFAAVGKYLTVAPA